MSVDESIPSCAKRYGVALLVLTALFAFRVVAQLVQVWYPVDILPPYTVWHSGALPYPLLVAIQGSILVVCLRIVMKLFKCTIILSSKQGKILLVLGIIYFASMSLRLIVGVTIAPDHFWFGATLPTVFHLVLASFVIIYGRFHCIVSRALLSR